MLLYCRRKGPLVAAGYSHESRLVPKKRKRVGVPTLQRKRGEGIYTLEKFELRTKPQSTYGYCQRHIAPKPVSAENDLPKSNIGGWRGERRGESEHSRLGNLLTSEKVLLIFGLLADDGKSILCLREPG